LIGLFDRLIPAGAESETTTGTPGAGAAGYARDNTYGELG
jgi:hypothetical protein